jgi:hypothetical protein
MNKKCDKYDLQEIEWFNMLIHKDVDVLSVIVRSKDLISTCLKCKHINDWCADTAEYIRALDRNKTV